MYRKISWLLSFLLLFCFPGLSIAQKFDQHSIDSIAKKTALLKPDTNKVIAYAALAKMPAYYQYDGTENDPALKSALYYAGVTFETARKIKWDKGIGIAYICYEDAYESIKKYDQAILYAQEAYQVSNKASYKNWAYQHSYPAYYYTAKAYLYTKQFADALNTDRAALNLYHDLPNQIALSYFYLNMADIYKAENDAKNELSFEEQSLRLVHEKKPSDDDIAVLQRVADNRRGRHDLVGSLQLLQKAKMLVNKSTSAIITFQVYSTIGGIYESLGDYALALESRKTALVIINNVPPSKANATLDQISVMGTMMAIAKCYRELGEYEQSLAVLKQLMLAKFTSLKTFQFFKIAAQDDMAQDYIMEGKYEAAWKSFRPYTVWRDSISKVQKSDYVSDDLLLLGKIYRDAPDSVVIETGIKPADKYRSAVNIFNAELHNPSPAKQLKPNDIYYELYKTYEKMGDAANAYSAYKKYITIRDSVDVLNNKNYVIRKDMQISYARREDSIHVKQVQLKAQLQLSNKDKEIQQVKFLQTRASLQAEQSKRTANEQKLKATQKEEALANTTVKLQDTEINAKKAQSYYLMAGIGAMVCLSFFIAQNYRNQRKANKQISFEKDRSENLLLNILPADVAEELKEKGSADARLFDEVTVLFTDFVNFTSVSELLTPQELLNELNVCFKTFDDIMTTHGIEKIKTIGDAYLAVSGLPTLHTDHAANTIRAAKEIQLFMADRKQQVGDKSFGIRIGIHSGSVVAGIVGVKKFAYDVWGDAVNTAARMEQNSQPGKINISEKTFQLVKDQFSFTYRGEIEAKNKGMMKMYFINN